MPGCHYCGVTLQRPRLTRDHIVPRDKGGLSAPWNIVLACHPCNNAKGNQMPDPDHRQKCQRCEDAVARWVAGERGESRAAERERIMRTTGWPKPEVVRDPAWSAPVPPEERGAVPEAFDDLACLSPAMRAFLTRRQIIESRERETEG
jgi:hypothetical protein